MRFRPIALALLAASSLLLIAFSQAAPTDQQVVKTPASDSLPIPSTQNPKDSPPTPQRSLAKVTVPAGFHVTLFAAEPDVRQPIAMTLDDRGRLWVVECYSYPEWSDLKRDRVLIFEDTDADGQFDRRTVFWDKGNHLSGIALGFGGVWLCSAPNLIFIPDTNRDDRPDGPPQVVLDGWNIREVQHNVVSGLTWGPDGWLWGRHGIKATSHVGTPGAPDADRVALNCSIWRYHPTLKTFEVVTRGTTNPWGLDFDHHGEAFFTNNVIGHLWHVVNGAHYKRMYGEGDHSHLYELMQSCSDHLHWAGGDWTKARGGKKQHESLGGGHSHCGGMIYLGDNWPKKYRGRMFMCNTHGNRVNQDILVRRGAGYVGLHGKDFLLANSPWFRGISLKYGPDGGVFLSDWTDIGECHDRDGIHRGSGRIYKIVHGKTKSFAGLDLARQTDEQLVALQLHPNEWFARHARRLLQERSAEGRDMRAVHRLLHKIFVEQTEVPRKLRAMWTLHATGGTSREWLMGRLDHEAENVRTWAVRLLCEDRHPDSDVVSRLAKLAKTEPSGLVRLHLASVSQRITLAARWAIVEALSQHSEDAGETNLSLLLWYAIEPLVELDGPRAGRLLSDCRLPTVRRLIARRATELGDEPGEDNRQTYSALSQVLTKSNSAAVTLDTLLGMREALRGRREATPPDGWGKVQAKLFSSDNVKLRETARLLAVKFGDASALAELRQTILDRRATKQLRQEALAALLEKRMPSLAVLLQGLLDDADMRGAALRGLSAIDHPKTPGEIILRYKDFGVSDRRDAVETLASRRSFALALFAAIEKKQIPVSDLSAFTARRLTGLMDQAIDKLLAKHWGTVRNTPKDKRAAIARYKKMLTPKRLERSRLINGRQVFTKTCAQCHKMFGEGGAIGPDLTGSNRRNLDYILENAVDPSAAVPLAFRVTTIVTDDGLTLSGILGPRTAKTITIQTATEKMVLDLADVDLIRTSTQSMMPDGLLDKLTDDQLRDLVAYLATEAQVNLP